MSEITLRFEAPGLGPQEVKAGYAVVHMPKPRHARTEKSDSPIFDQLMEELFHAGS